MPYSDFDVNAYKSERLVYRAIEDDEEDKAWISEFLQNDPVATVMGEPRLALPQPLSAASNYIEHPKRAVLSLLICLPLEDDGTVEEVSDESSKASGANGKKKKRRPQPVGQISLNGKGYPALQHHRNAMIGLSIAAPYRGKGYGGEAINWVLDWGFRRANLHRIDIGAWSYNEPALRLYRKLGFVEEGREREAVWYDRKWHDIVSLGMLEHEWERLRGIEKS
ncbi:acyl-CoA N-acyltransferase [Thozetella sp. PMI_491]|nr:acyl-CoA N-acyltransferase [Thozetella sp. PMI_491]